MTKKPETQPESPQRSRKLRWNPDDPEDTKRARAEFNQARREGMTAYRYRERTVKEAEEIRRFDPKAGELLLATRLVGG